MHWSLYLLLGLIALPILIFAIGLIHLIGSRRSAERAILRIELEEIESLARDCQQVFQEKLGITLTMESLSDAAEQLERGFADSYQLKEAFARDDLYWHFVMPVGAFLGELLRVQAGFVWSKEPGQSPTMSKSWGDNEAQVFPFDKVIKHATSGSPGDLLAYIEVAKVVEQQAL